MAEFLNNMSTRERRLALVVVVLLIGLLVYGAVRPALAHLRALDNEIGYLHDAYLNYERYLARRDDIDRAFSKIAADHSSALTEEEIRDGLNAEIYRLTFATPLPYATGNAKQAAASSPQLVEIPELRGGQLKDSGQGYREYVLEFRTRETSIDHISTFLRRLQESPQALRIEKLEISRPAQSGRVTATMEVTRTVVDGLPEPVQTSLAERAESDNLARNPSFEEWAGDGSGCFEWVVRNCVTASNRDFNTHQTRALQAKSTGNEARLFQVHELSGGASYSLSLDVTAFGPARLEVVSAATGDLFEGATDVYTDGRPHRYSIAFTVPGRSGGKQELYVPCITLQELDSSVCLDNVVLKKAEG